MAETKLCVAMNGLAGDTKSDPTSGGIQYARMSSQLVGQLELVQAKVQFPPDGPISVHSLLWCLRETRQIRQRQAKDPKKVAVVQQCFISTSRVQDFIVGMENTKGDVTCKFVKIRTKPAKDGEKYFATETTANEVTRYHCQFGPQDHSANIKTISSVLLRKQRPKAVVAGAMKTKGKAKQKMPLAEGEVQLPKQKKTRTKKKSTKENDAEGAVKPKRTRATKKPPLPSGDNELGVGEIADTVRRLSMESGYRTSRNTVTVVASHVGENSAQPAQRQSELRRRRPRRNAVVPAAPESALLSTDPSAIPSSDKPKTPPRLSIDLNLAATTVESSRLPLTEAESRVLRWQASSAIKLQRKTKKVLCKRPKAPKKKPVTLPAAFLELDLNGPPPPHYETLDVATLTSTVVEAQLPPTQCAPAMERSRAERDASKHDIEAQTSNIVPMLISPNEQENTDLPTTKPSGTKNSPQRPAVPVKRRDSLKQWGGGLKRGCLASFSVKTLYLLPHVTEITLYQSDHVNEASNQCHGLSNAGDRSAFTWHLSEEIKEFVLKLLRDGHSVPQIMSKHIQIVKDSLNAGSGISRDMFLHERDVRNLATKVARETYMLHTFDAKSVQMWVEQNRDSIFFYHETGLVTQGTLTHSTIPFTIGIQTPWQRDMLVRFGHESGVSIDATFGTNENKFPLYTVMVFDEWHNGIPVAFIITSRSAQEDLTPWMRALDVALRRDMPNWKPNAFIVDCAPGEINSLRVVWPNTAIFLCLWHVHRAWQKQACIKIQDIDTRAAILRGLCSIMYERSDFSGVAAADWATWRLQQLQFMHPTANEFWDYVREQWLPKVHMWVVGYRNLPYAGQDTNAAVESYHGYMKSVLKAERSRMTGRRVDWCIHVLTGDVLTHYWYQRVRKQFGFVDNRKEREIVVSALILARDIPDIDVTLPEFEGGPAFVTSCAHRHLRYVVHNPGELWASCNCVHAQRGNTCKHKVKVLRLMQPELAEGIVARYCGARKGLGVAGPSDLLVHGGIPVTPVQYRAEVVPDSARKIVDLQTTVTNLAQEILDFSKGNDILMEHLHADLHKLQGKMKTLKADIESGIIHPVRSTPVFQRVEDGLGMGLGRLRDMLEARRRTPIYRRLRLGGDSPA